MALSSPYLLVLSLPLIHLHKCFSGFWMLAWWTCGEGELHCSLSWQHRGLFKMRCKLLFATATQGLLSTSALSWPLIPCSTWAWIQRRGSLVLPPPYHAEARQYVTPRRHIYEGIHRSCHWYWVLHWALHDHRPHLVDFLLCPWLTGSCDKIAYCHALELLLLPLALDVTPCFGVLYSWAVFALPLWNGNFERGRNSYAVFKWTTRLHHPGLHRASRCSLALAFSFFTLFFPEWP
jgi:hypothetical protein